MAGQTAWAKDDAGTVGGVGCAVAEAQLAGLERWRVGLGAGPGVGVQSAVATGAAPAGRGVECGIADAGHGEVIDWDEVGDRFEAIDSVDGLSSDELLVAGADRRADEVATGFGAVVQEHAAGDGPLTLDRALGVWGGTSPLGSKDGVAVAGAGARSPGGGGGGGPVGGGAAGGGGRGGRGGAKGGRGVRRGPTERAELGGKSDGGRGSASTGRSSSSASGVDRRREGTASFGGGRGSSAAGFELAFGAGPRSGSAGDGELLSERDLREIEKNHPEGITSVQVVDFFTRRGLRFSEATFRKYVQQGLLPRSRRVGRKGKHQGSLGLYPAAAVRRINVIKRLQAENYTIEEIQSQFLRFRDEMEAIERSLATLFSGFEEELSRPQFDTSARKQLQRDLGDAQLAAEELVKQLESIERRVAGPKDRPPGGGAPGGAEDLL